MDKLNTILTMKVNKFLNITDYKIILTIHYLNELGFLPSAQGVHKIITGVNDEETENFSLCPTFQVLVSYSSKKLTRDINSLVSNGYVHRIHKEEYSDYYFELTEQGIASMHYYETHHKINLKKHEINRRPTIIKKTK